MKNVSIRILIGTALLLAPLALSEQAAAKGGGPILLSGSLMGFFNSSEQGGEGPEGSTLLTQVDLVKQWEWYGLGFFGQLDKQGEAETDIGFGPKVEIHRGAFYLEGGWIMSVSRAYTDRSIEEQTGYGWLLGFGARFPLGKGGKGKGMFLQFSYKYRIHHIKEQDGDALSEPIIQRDGYPLFGLGLQF
ncbi:MAG: hypothetical protein IT285_14275 [Bdellovibrionales bacterium]|nr:hypothetical protein [Bdellovibrionales bacterium]